jgi:mannose-6-phosphate isomerase
MDQLIGAIQRYDWGDPSFIPRLQGRRPTGRPEAELWFGAHPVAPSRLATSGRSLADLVAADPGGVLGPEVEVYRRLPFLVKILASAQPLSIQAHPSRARAQAGFAREEAAGLARTSPERTYRDDNHKPELLAALTLFEAKCGFRPLVATRALIDLLAVAGGGPAVAELQRRMAPGPGSTDAAVVASVFGWLLSLPAPAIGPLVSEVVAASEKVLAGAGPANPSGSAAFEPELAWTVVLDQHHPGDIGVVVALLLNHVVLEPGQAVFLASGNLHAYLRGAGVEVMANSDNVIRGGLTTKHVDGAELAAVVDYQPAPAPVQSAAGPRHRYEVPSPEFALTRMAGLVGVERVQSNGPEIVLVTEGTVAVRSGRGGEPVVIGPGQAAFVSWSDRPYLVESTVPAVWWRVEVGAADELAL